MTVLTQQQLNTLNSIQSQTEAQFKAAYHANPAHSPTVDYYSALQDYDVSYGGLALGVSRNDTSSGQFANAYAASVANASGVDMSVGSDTWLSAQYHIMRGDFSTRNAVHGKDLTWKQYDRFHAAAFEKAHPLLGAETWTAHTPLSQIEAVNPRIADAMWNQIMNNTQPIGSTYVNAILMMASHVTAANTLEKTQAQIDAEVDLGTWLYHAKNAAQALAGLGFPDWALDAMNGMSLPTAETLNVWGQEFMGNLREAWGDSGIPSALSDLKNLLRSALRMGDPLVLDMDESGTIELTSLTGANAHPVYFDMNADGYAEATAFATGGDGVLCIDKNGDGIINDGKELFGDQTGKSNGFELLKAYDTNQDGRITQEDQRFDKLHVWIDANGDGFSQSSELHSLSDKNITNINLSYANVNQNVNGNPIKQAGTFTINGIDRAIVDAYFQADATNTVSNRDYTLDPGVLFMPTARGYGQLADLHIAMSLDNTGAGNLKSLIQQFQSLSLVDMFSATVGKGYDQARGILLRWAGSEGIAVDARGRYVNARELAFIEALTGEKFLQSGVLSNPTSQAGHQLDLAFKGALNYFFAHLAAQSAAQALFTGDVSYNIATDRFTGITGLNHATVDALKAAALSLPSSPLDEKSLFWQNVARAVEGTQGIANLSSGDKNYINAAITASGASGTLDTAWTLAAQAQIYGSTVIGTAGDDDLISANGAVNPVLDGKQRIKQSSPADHDFRAPVRRSISKANARARPLCWRG